MNLDERKGKKKKKKKKKMLHPILLEGRNFIMKEEQE